jgi:hypothetical protein
MNRHERARLTMAKCSISEGEEQIAHLSELIKVLELRAISSLRLEPGSCWRIFNTISLWPMLI